MGALLRTGSARAVAAAASAVLALVVTAAAPVPTAHASTVGCPPVTIYLSTTGAGQTLRGYDATGVQTSSVLLGKDYGDIALDAGGGVLYGITLDNAGATALDTRDVQTGALLSSRLITGDVSQQGNFNALSAQPDGSLLAGTLNSGVLYRIDPATASSTTSPLALPAGAVSAGDFVTLDDGDVLALVDEGGAGATTTSLARLHPDGTSTLVGRLPTTAFGITQDAGQIDVAESTGDLVQLSAVPPDAPSTAVMSTTTLASTGLPFSGATSVQDSGSCAVLPGPSAPPQPALPAQTVTVTVAPTVPLASGTAQAEATSSAGGAITWATSDPSVATIGPDGVLVLRAAGNVTATATAAATATSASGSASAVVRVLDAPASSLPQGTSRLGGSDGVDTAAEISSTVFPDPPDDGSTDVVIATSATFADAITGARLAGLLRGPLLLTSPDHLDPAAATEARRLAGVTGTVYLLGQQQAISDDVEAALRAQSPGYAVQRIGGADRYQTAAAVAAVVTARSGDVGPIYVVTGRDFADGVCAAPYAERTGGVVLLTDGALSPSTASYLAAHDPSGTRTVAVGGTAGSALAATSVRTTAALVGEDRYGTSALLARRFSSAAGVTGAVAPVASVGLAGGSSWSDALAGAAAMSYDGGPLLLTPSGAAQLPDATRDALSTLAPGLARAVVFGGSDPVPPTVTSQVSALLGH